MKIGSIVALVDEEYGIATHIGIVDCIDPEEIGDTNEVLVVWNDGDESSHSVEYLELICE